MTASSTTPPKPGRIPPPDFDAIYSEGRKAVGRRLILFFSERETGCQLAVVASRKIGGAVQRNRAKRLLREAFRIHLGRLAKPGAYLLLARAGIDESKTQEIAGELEKLLTRLKLLSETR